MYGLDVSVFECLLSILCPVLFSEEGPAFANHRSAVSVLLYVVNTNFQKPDIDIRGIKRRLRRRKRCTVWM